MSLTSTSCCVKITFPKSHFQEQGVQNKTVGLVVTYVLNKVKRERRKVCIISKAP